MGNIPKRIHRWMVDVINPYYRKARVIQCKETLEWIFTYPECGASHELWLASLLLDLKSDVENFDNPVKLPRRWFILMTDNVVNTIAIEEFGPQIKKKFPQWSSDIQTKVFEDLIHIWDYIKWKDGFIL